MIETNLLNKVDQWSYWIYQYKYEDTIQELAAQEHKLKVLCTNNCLQDDIYQF